MDDRVIAALAKGLVPFVRETIKQELALLDARLLEVETRPSAPGPQGEIGPPGPSGPQGVPGSFSELLPPELAEEVASAVRLLHESPPIAARAAALSSQPPLRIARIERDDDGNLVPFYAS